MASILIVDDSYIARMKIRNVVTKAGYIVAGEAENGLQALNVFSEARPDLVTLDITMPVMDGIATLKNIIEINPKALVVMVSAVGQQFMVLESIKSGARHFVVKPFEDDGLLKIITEVLQHGPNPKAAEPAKHTDEPTNSRVEVSDNKDGFNIENISGTFIIDINTLLNSESLRNLETAVIGLSFVKPLRVIFDFKDVEFLENEYLSTLDRVIGSVKKSDGEVKVVSRNEKFQSYLKMSGLEQFKMIESNY